MVIASHLSAVVAPAFQALYADFKASMLCFVPVISVLLVTTGPDIANSSQFD